MKEIIITLPDSVEMDNVQCSIFLATKLYENGTLSLGQAADMAELSKSTFIEMLGKYNVSIFNHSAQELEKDILNA